MKLKFIGSFAVLLFLALHVANGQPGDPGDKPGEETVPIGGIEILLISGVALGVKKIVGSKKNP